MTLTNVLLPILEGHFRANPEYELILFDRLPIAQQEQLQSLVGDDSFYGVLRDRDPKNSEAKAIDQETALLLFSLNEAGPIPGYVQRKFGEDCNRAIAELVLEGVIEYAPPGEDDFVSGGAAHALLFVEDRHMLQSDNRLVQLSYDALLYAQRLPRIPTADLSMRLYRYNTIPYSAAWRRAWQDGHPFKNDLAQAMSGPVSAMLDRHWQFNPPPDNNSGWLSWQAAHRRASTSGEDRLRFKLYISPMPDAFSDAWPIIIEELSRAGAPAFKIGRDIEGLLRPDKIVVYLYDFATLSAVAGELEQALAALPAQGVPFTAPIDDRGMLSWGMDPQDIFVSFDPSQEESWRSWITSQLAGAIVDAKKSASGDEPRKVALDRLRLIGVDTENWTLKQSLWNQSGRSTHVRP